jgi:uncharacterized protein (TIGR00730 family)
VVNLDFRERTASSMTDSAILMDKNLCVYCGSAVGFDAEFAEAARRVGRALARTGIGLVYGGGRAGLMGVVADAVLDNGGTVIGVIPEVTAIKEVAHDGLTELILVANMHQRKALMASRSQAFLTLPGGIGTFEEFFETLSWAGLGLHQKPMGILNVTGYFDPLLSLLDQAVNKQFARLNHILRLVVSNDPESVVEELMNRAERESPGESIDLSKT